MIEEAKVEIGEEGIEEAVLGSESKHNLQVVDFPIFRIENAFVKTDSTKSITVNFEKSFLHAPIVHILGLDTIRSMYMSREKFKVTYDWYVYGYIPYTAIGMTADKREWSLEEELKELKDTLENKLKEADMKIAGGAAVGALSGVTIEELIKRL